MFDLESYEDVATRIKKFRDTFISGRIEVSIVDVNFEKGYVLMKAEAYREHEDLVPAAVDYAYEVRSDRGVNRDFWIENASTSCIGRVLGLLSPSEKRPTRQDMEKVERLSHVSAPSDPWATFTVETSEIDTVGQVLQLVSDQLGGEIVETTPLCAHGRMIHKSGTSSKTNKPYEGYVCPSKIKADQCQAVWL
jgi:hypothetical protein